MSLLPSYKQLWEKRYGKPLPPDAAAVEVPVWNALLDAAIKQVWQAQDDFVRAGEYQSAAVARDLHEALELLKGDVASGSAEEPGTTAT